MDEETRRHIREAEWVRMRAREDDARFHDKREFENQQANDKRVDYVMKHGRQEAVARTLMKWTIGSLILAIIVFLGMWERDGLGQALIYLLMSPLFGYYIGVYQAAKLPNV